MMLSLVLCAVLHSYPYCTAQYACILARSWMYARFMLCTASHMYCTALHCTALVLPVQISQAAMSPATSFIATPAASWIDDFLSWTNPSLPKCCR
jgi:hypothetical protein